MRRRARRWANLGLAGWIAVGRRIAPWGLLVFALFQMKALSDKVKQVEQTEFSAVQTQVETLKAELTHLSDAVKDSERTLSETQKTLKSVNQTLEQAKKHTPELVKAIDDARDVSVAVKTGLPPAAEAEELAKSVESADGVMTQVLTALPTAKVSGELSTEVETAKQSLSKLPDPAAAAAFSSELAEEQKKIDALGAVLNELKNKSPNPEQLLTLQRDLAKAHEVLANLTPANVTPANIAPAAKGAAN